MKPVDATTEAFISLVVFALFAAILIHPIAALIIPGVTRAVVRL